MSLLDRIKEAASVSVVNVLLEEGARYDHASDKTRRRWRAAAEARINTLTADAGKRDEEAGE